MKQIIENRKAFFDFLIDEKLEVGIVLSGSEIKSIRLGKVNLNDAYIIIKNDEMFLVGAYIATYEKTSNFVLDQTRTRKLLAHKNQIKKFSRLTKTKNYVIVPLNLYLKDGLAKLEIGLGKPKKLYDKRQTLKERDLKRDLERVMKHNKPNTSFN